MMAQAQQSMREVDQELEERPELVHTAYNPRLSFEDQPLEVGPPGSRKGATMPVQETPNLAPDTTGAEDLNRLLKTAPQSLP